MAKNTAQVCELGCTMSFDMTVVVFGKDTESKHFCQSLASADNINTSNIDRFPGLVSYPQLHHW